MRPRLLHGSVTGAHFCLLGAGDPASIARRIRSSSRATVAGSDFLACTGLVRE